jgi:hypothetical protein
MASQFSIDELEVTEIQNEGLFEIERFHLLVTTQQLRLHIQCLTIELQPSRCLRLAEPTQVVPHLLQIAIERQLQLRPALQTPLLCSLHLLSEKV